GHDALEQPQYAAHRPVPVERGDEMHLRRARIGETGIDSPCQQGLNQNFRTVHGWIVLRWSSVNVSLTIWLLAVSPWIGELSMSLASSHVDLHTPRQTKKPKFAFAEIMAGLVILAVVIGLGAVAAFSTATTLP